VIGAAAAALVGGIAWRVRGAAFGSTPFSIIASGQLVRLLAALAMVLIPALAHGPWLLMLCPALFAGMCLAGWGDDFDIGRNGGSQTAETLRMSGWGLLTVAPTAAVLWWLGGAPWPVLVAGAFFGPAYSVCWHLTPRLPAVPRFAAGPTEWAEVTCGALIAVGVMFASMEWIR
jgi:hypothetical protein